MNNDIAERVKKIVVEYLGVDDSKVTDGFVTNWSAPVELIRLS